MATVTEIGKSIFARNSTRTEITEKIISEMCIKIFEREYKIIRYVFMKFPRVAAFDGRGFT